MLQLLVDRRDDLELGQLIPVGDLYDAIAEGDEPFSEGMRLHFENAKRLYNQRLLPMLERQHNVTWESITLGQADAAAAKNLRNDARLLKTLLLGALVPEVESLKALTAQRLAALNHGTFRSPIPGREAQDVLRKCRDWASEIGEITRERDRGDDGRRRWQTSCIDGRCDDRRRCARGVRLDRLVLPGPRRRAGSQGQHNRHRQHATREAVHLVTSQPLSTRRSASSNSPVAAASLTRPSR